MRIDLAPAIVLHRRAWRDTSLIVEALTRDHGRIAAVAKGARRGTSRWRGLLEPLSQVTLSWAGRGELYTLRGVEYERQIPLSGNALMGALYASELVMRLTARDDPHTPIYHSLCALLDTMGHGAPAIMVLRFFERDLLDELGYGLTLETAADGAPIRAERIYRWDADEGFVSADRPAPHGAPRVQGATLQGLAGGRLVERAQLHEARTLMQAALAPHIGAKPLKSVATLQAMQQFAAPRTPASTDDRPAEDDS
ncbi:DNA repair protein RecO [Salinisphaera sp. Q1T1-3]|uniref:DNA repair protein RecO n=1 Tax=Salinisphaera sp. Q1T1-3 TaxID=2321229 RepID=UPI000E749B96|nr:DNA repair protein RecO [Salinisphaera sp. Q1T1-3]RJS92048.1 DNA repair protein RecO [Salinisphaera sp. Q1T1-3]